MPYDKRYFVEGLRRQLVASAAISRRSEEEARDAARTMATEAEKREDSRAMLEFGRLATGHAERARKILEEIQILDGLLARGLPHFGPKSPIAVGAIVDVATEDQQGPLERTFIVLPVGAAAEVEGPGGDGFLTVVTPNSPVGTSLMGRRAGEIAEVVLRREPFEWEILAVA